MIWPVSSCVMVAVVLVKVAVHPALQTSDIDRRDRDKVLSSNTCAVIATCGDDDSCNVPVAVDVMILPFGS